MKVLIACEYSAIVRDAFRNKGHDAYSCDLEPTEGDPKWHIQGNVLDILNSGWDLMVAHPMCTFLTNAGVRHLHDHVSSRNGTKTKISGSVRWVKLFEAAEFFNKLKNANIPKIAIENPIPHKYARALIGNYTQLVQPWQFGHNESKPICLWLKNLPKLTTTHSKPAQIYSYVNSIPSGPNQAKERSRFFPNIAEQMANQWG